MAPWKLPLVVAAIVLPITVAFVLGGGGVGVAAGALVAVAIVVFAVRQRPHGPIASAAAGDARRHVLIVATCPVERPDAVRWVLRSARLGDEGEDADVLVLAPARIGFLDRWASDVEGARREAQKSLVSTVAALAKAGVAAEARVGDEDVVQAVEDQLRSFPASEVVLVTGGEGNGEAGDAAAVELRSRLEPGFQRVVLD